MYDSTGKYPLRYIDNAANVALEHHKKVLGNSDLPSFHHNSVTSIATFFDIAVLLNLREYVSIKVKTLDKNEIKHAIAFSQGVRKRLGRGGEMRWLSGKGVERLREEYSKESGEVEKLIAGYANKGWFGSGKASKEEEIEYI